MKLRAFLAAMIWINSKLKLTDIAEITAGGERNGSSRSPDSYTNGQLTLVRQLPIAAITNY